MKHPFKALAATLAAIILLLSKPAAQDFKPAASKSDWILIQSASVKYKDVEGMHSRPLNWSGELGEGKLRESAAKDYQIRALVEHWKHVYYSPPKKRSGFRIPHNLFVLSIPGVEGDWWKEKNIGDALRIQQLCGAYLDMKTPGLLLNPDGKLKWSKKGNLQFVEFSLKGTFQDVENRGSYTPYKAQGWVVDLAEEELVFVFAGPDNERFSFKKTLKTMGRIVTKLKVLNLEEMAAETQKKAGQARGKMKKRSWTTPLQVVGPGAWLSGEEASKPLKASFEAAGKWFLNNQKNSHWECGLSKRSEKDIGVTSLVGRALIGIHSCVPALEVIPALNQAEEWLVNQQGEDGRIGKSTSKSAAYCHAMASHFLLDLYTTVGQDKESLKKVNQSALDFISQSQDLGGGWNYDLKSTNEMEGDPSVTYWSMVALMRGKECGFEVDLEKIRLASESILQKAEENGRVGYEGRSSGVARFKEDWDVFTQDKTESLTGAGLYCTLLANSLSLSKMAPTYLQWNATSLILQCLPCKDSAAFDLYYWQVASCGMGLMGGKEAKIWREALNRALLPMQISKGSDVDFGAWPATSVWSSSGGMAYATAMATLSLLNANSSPR